MKEKTPKSPILVVATMMVLAMFIVLPPMLRAYMPKDDEIVKVKIIKHSLYCEKISASENKKISSRILYENDVAVKNTMTYMDYTPSQGQIDVNPGNIGIPVEQEINFLKSVTGADIQENASQIIITLTQQNVIDNAMNVELLNYLSDTEVEKEFFEGNGFFCSKIED